MRLRHVAFLLFILLFFPAIVFCSPGEREKVIQETLDKLKKESSPEVIPLPGIAPFPQIIPPAQDTPLEKEFPSGLFSQRQSIIKKTLDEIEIAIAVKIGYLTGDTTYDWSHHVSELMFPMDNWMAGADLTFAFKNFSFNAEIWGAIEEESGTKGTDKDWSGDTLISSTESRSKMDAIIWDVNLRYDFYKKIIPKNINMLRVLATDKIKVGVLLGYKYERFDFDWYDVYYTSEDPTFPNTMFYEGVLALTYKIEYWIPYIGLAAEILRKDYGLRTNVKYAIYPTAKHIDNHLLRTPPLTFYADYDDPSSKAWMFGVDGFWQFRENWELSLGLDVLDIQIGGVMWEESYTPGYQGDIFTDTRQVIFWSGVKYKF